MLFILIWVLNIDSYYVATKKLRCWMHINESTVNVIIINWYYCLAFLLFIPSIILTKNINYVICCRLLKNNTSRYFRSSFTKEYTINYRRNTKHNILCRVLVLHIVVIHRTVITCNKWSIFHWVYCISVSNMIHYLPLSHLYIAVRNSTKSSWNDLHTVMRLSFVVEWYFNYKNKLTFQT